MKVITNWRNATEELTKAFCKKYFPDGEYGKDSWWVCDEVGTIFCIGDYFFSVDRMLEALELKASPTKFFAYYDFEFECGMTDEPVRINFRNYIKYGLVGKAEK